MKMVNNYTTVQWDKNCDIDFFVEADAALPVHLSDLSAAASPQKKNQYHNFYFYWTVGCQNQ